MRRANIGTLDLSVIDSNDADTKYIYDEIFGSQIYDCRYFRVPENPNIMDVGANIGLYALWAQQKYRPRAIYSYEASPKTFLFLRDNVSRLIDRNLTKVTAINHAMASEAGQKLVLHQSTEVSGISTLLNRGNVGWIEQASANDQLRTHEVITSTVSAEIEANGLAVVDILKIDVEGYFLEVLKGIAPKDFPKIRNIVAEVDYLPETGITPDAFEKMLTDNGYKTDCFDRSQQNNLTFYAWRD